MDVGPGEATQVVSDNILVTKLPLREAARGYLISLKAFPLLALLRCGHGDVSTSLRRLCSGEETVRKAYTSEQIINKLHEAEIILTRLQKVSYHSSKKQILISNSELLKIPKRETKNNPLIFAP